MDAVLLSRWQFAANVSFHILFPTISIALGWMLLFFRWRHLRSADAEARAGWLAAYRVWTKVFALTFALGVVSGITMSFQFGTNWPGFMERAGNVAGPLLAYEVLTAFFLEAGFLGVMLFGHSRVGERVHLMATFFVAFGTTLSAFWILALNSWMHTPAGHEVIDGVFHVRDWTEVVFNPSFPFRLAHVLMASALSCAFLMAGFSVWQIRRGSAPRSAPRVLRTALMLAALVAPLQMLAGDLHGLNTLAHQPQKIAAMEGIWQTERRVPLLLFALPDEQARTNRLELGVPALASLILRHDADGELRGVDDFPHAHPPVAPVFWAFRVMVGMGVLMLLTAWWACWAGRRVRWRAEALPGALLRWLGAMTFSGWVATLAGWYVTEIGRQPFVVYGILRTSEVVARVAPGHVALTLAMYLALYLALLAAYVAVLRYLAHKPEPDEP